MAVKVSIVFNKNAAKRRMQKYDMTWLSNKIGPLSDLADLADGVCIQIKRVHWSGNACTARSREGD